MNPIAQEALAAIVRWGLALAAGYLVKAGIWSASDSTTYVGAATIGLVALGWSLWQKYAARLKLLTALSLSQPTSEAAVEAAIDRGFPTPAITSRKDMAPVVGA